MYCLLLTGWWIWPLIYVYRYVAKLVTTYYYKYIHEIKPIESPNRVLRSKFR